jgi:spore photoproduct lyase
MQKIKLIVRVIRKALDIKFSGRSTDFLTPSFGFGCLYRCLYCYMRRHKKTGVNFANNIGDLLTAVHLHAYKEQMLPSVTKPNQTDPEFITYDLSCNEDFALHGKKHHDWQRIFEFFRDHPYAKGSFATKYVPLYMTHFNPEKKIRIRFSLMPQKISDILEPNTTRIIDRIQAVNGFIECGYEVHLNFSPVVYYPNWKEDYEELFHLVNDNIDDEYKDEVLCEVIFLTHNVEMHKYNLSQGFHEAENLLWNPEIQETKISSYGGKNIRYKRHLKSTLIKKFILMHDKIIPWNKIRYIF